MNRLRIKVKIKLIFAAKMANAEETVDFEVEKDDRRYKDERTAGFHDFAMERAAGLKAYGRGSRSKSSDVL